MHLLRKLFWSIVVLWSAVLARPSTAADYAETERMFFAGQYDQCAAECQSEVDRRTWNPQWTRLLVRCQLAIGKYSEALASYETGLERFSDDLRLRLIGVQVYQRNNRGLDAKKQLAIMTEAIQKMPWRYSGRDELVPLGQLLLTQGEDPRQVLELCLDKALKTNPANVEALQVSTELALDKSDFQEASRSVAAAIKTQPLDPQLHYLQALAWSETDDEQSTAALLAALKLNPRHVPSLLMAAENKVDAEQYDEAEMLLQEVLAVNPHEPLAWANRSIIAHLQGRYEAEGECRRTALEPWKLNPAVDTKIAEKLSRHYRFEEAVEAYRRALTMEPLHQAAMAGLAQDLLRLGKTEEGWKVLEAFRSNDQYNVVAFNLSKLRDQLDKFTSLETDGLVVRMEAREAKIYGDAVIDLLSRARRTLTEKYAAKLEEPVYVEIFPNQQDFAIRTFGLPGGEGYLGVCFGRLITANSPASGGEQPQNWQSVLWHEYCHVVTLQKSKNRMPRWLSEGISVYEEREENGTWGQPMDRQYRAMLLGDDLTPLSELSSAFLRPKSGLHLQFAYFESSLAVRFLIQQYSFASLTRLLDDLGAGLPINAALERLTGSLSALDEQFEAYAIAQANAYGPDADWQPMADEEIAIAGEATNPRSRPAGPGGGRNAVDPEELQNFLASHPNNALALRATAKLQLARRNYDDALQVLTELQKVEPDDYSIDGVYSMLAACYRKLERGDDEYKTLSQFATHCPNSLDAWQRLIELDTEKKEWAKVLDWANRYLAVQPLRSAPHAAIVQAATVLGELEKATESLQSLLELDPLDPAELHFQLAKALRPSNPKSAKRHLLQTLELAPRYLAALRLLHEMTEH